MTKTQQRKIRRIRAVLVAAAAATKVFCAVGLPLNGILTASADTGASVPEIVFQETTGAVNGTADTAREDTVLTAAPLYDVPLDDDLQQYIVDACRTYEIDPAVILAMIELESKYDAGATGDKGRSIGLMQIQPRWHTGRMEKLGCTDLYDPRQNVTVGIDYLASQIERYDGNLAQALTAYNQGHYRGKVNAYAVTVLSRAEEIAGTIQ